MCNGIASSSYRIKNRRCRVITTQHLQNTKTMCLITNYYKKLT